MWIAKSRKGVPALSSPPMTGIFRPEAQQSQIFRHRKTTVSRSVISQQHAKLAGPQIKRLSHWRTICSRHRHVLPSGGVIARAPYWSPVDVITWGFHLQRWRFLCLLITTQSAKATCKLYVLSLSCMGIVAIDDQRKTTQLDKNIVSY